MKELSQKIQNAAAHLFFRGGIKHVSMDDLSKSLKISKKTLYHCFQNKTQLVQQTVHQHFEGIELELERIAKLPCSAIEKILEATDFAVTQLSMVNPSMIQDLHKYYPEIHIELLKRREKAVIKHILDNIRNGREEGLYRFDFNEDLISQLFAHQIIYITENLNSKNSDLAVNAVKEFAIYHLRGISTDVGIHQIIHLTTNETL